MKSRQFLEQCRGISGGRIGQHDAFEVLRASCRSVGVFQRFRARSLLQNGARRDAERARLVIHQSADDLQIEVGQDDGIVEVHALAVTGEIRKLRVCADGKVRHAAGAACPDRSGQQTQSERR